MSRPKHTEPRPTLVRRPGRRKWYIQWTPVGTRRTRRYSTGYEDAEHAGQELARFKRRLTEPGQRPTVAQILDAYLKNRKGNVVDYDRLVYAVSAIKSVMGHLDPGEVTEYSRDVANETVRKEIRTFNAAMSLAVKRKWIIEAPTLEMPPRTSSHDKFLTRAQAAKLVKQAKTAHLRLFMMIGFHTGARKTAILQLKWDMVDWERSWLDFNEPGRSLTKKRRPAERVGKSLMAALQTARKAAQTDYVIEWNGKPVKSVQTSWDKAATKAGVSWATPHSMKYAVISWLSEDDFSPNRISDFTATSLDTVLRIYRRFNPNYLKELADSLDTPMIDDSAPTGRTNNTPKKKRREKQGLLTGQIGK